MSHIYFLYLPPSSLDKLLHEKELWPFDKSTIEHRQNGNDTKTSITRRRRRFQKPRILFKSHLDPMSEWVLWRAPLGCGVIWHSSAAESLAGGTIPSPEFSKTNKLKCKLIPRDYERFSRKVFFPSSAPVNVIEMLKLEVEAWVRRRWMIAIYIRK